MDRLLSSEPFHNGRIVHGAGLGNGLTPAPSPAEGCNAGASDARMGPGHQHGLALEQGKRSQGWDPWIHTGGIGVALHGLSLFNGAARTASRGASGRLLQRVSHIAGTLRHLHCRKPARPVLLDLSPWGAKAHMGGRGGTSLRDVRAAPLNLPTPVRRAEKAKREAMQLPGAPSQSVAWSSGEPSGILRTSFGHPSESTWGLRLFSEGYQKVLRRIDVPSKEEVRRPLD